MPGPSKLPWAGVSVWCWQTGAQTVYWGKSAPPTMLWVLRSSPLSIDVGSGGWSGLPGGSGCQRGDVAGARVWPPGAGCARAAPGGAGSLCGLRPGFSPGLPGPAGHLQCAEVRPSHTPGWSQQRSCRPPMLTLLFHPQERAPQLLGCSPGPAGAGLPGSGREAGQWRPASAGSGDPWGLPDSCSPVSPWEGLCLLRDPLQLRGRRREAL